MAENLTLETGKSPFSDGIKILKSSIPATETILDAYIPVAEASLSEIKRLSDWDKIDLPVPNPLIFEQGRPLLADLPLPDFGNEFSNVSIRMVEALKSALPHLEPEFQSVLKALEKTDFANQTAQALWEGNPERIDDLSEEEMLSTKALHLAGVSVLDVFLKIIHDKAAPLINNLRWTKGYCPICGSFPDIALFRKSGTDDPYLKSHGGQRWLHCASCGHEWRFKRGTCVYCENQKHEELKYFQSSDRMTERIDVCEKCRRYLINIDSREYIKEPDLRIAAKAYIHLDIIAQQKGYTPLAITGWNSI
ncbi:formate dehydrogenase accessory protein FdhE [Maridesulfovibrio bastinii]|uniref:formate dehydrogenase accessory protein FdhE n=1 Tax=Maridesulfovibrio bastinii TaxID=47157 RepID=UPI0004045308|nr:formate dehydrogenase accessory protein FdhE [Maridesulfovibrio bastinii]